MADESDEKDKKTPTPPVAPTPAEAAPPAKPEEKAPKADPLKAPVPSKVVDRLREKYPDAVTEVSYYAGAVLVRLRKERFTEIATFLRDDDALRMDFLSDLTAVHWPDRPLPFEIVYHLCSIPNRHEVTLKLEVAEGEEAPTACDVWPTANWQEREIFDLFGVRFTGHPDMTRILLPDEWEGHPLRKDFPLEGRERDHMQLREVDAAEHVYDYDGAPLRGFGWKKEVEKTEKGKA